MSFEESLSFGELLNNIQKRINKFVDDNFKKHIEIVVNDFFPSLNSQDKQILSILTIFIVDIISMKLGFDNTEPFYYQWKQNNNRDLKGAILLLLPFIDDKNNAYLLKKLTDLNQFLYAFNKKTINSNLKNQVREEILGTEFEFGNMGIGLISENNNDNILDLYPNGEKLIYKLLHHNLVGLLQTLEIINGKFYINWVNTVPLNLINYIDSNIFNKTQENLIILKNLLITNNKNNVLLHFSNNLTTYSGLWYGDIYNVIRNKLYNEAKPIKWLFFPYEISNDNKLYLIQGLNKMININKIINSEYNEWLDLSIEEQFNFNKNVEIILNNFESRKTITGLFDVDIEILKYTLVYLISNHFVKNDIKVEGILKKFKLTNSEEDQKDEDFVASDFNKINEIKYEDITECLKIIHNLYCKDLWNYIKYTIEQLSNTSYYKYLIDDNNQIRTTYYYKPFNNKFNENQQDIKLNIKNIYNIAKTLSHNDLKNWNLLEDNYIGLMDDNKINFLNRINNLSKNWINLQGNLKRQFININFNYDNELNKILKDFSVIYLNLVFEELVCNGLLNKFVLNRPITDKLLLPKDTGPMISKRKELIKDTFKKNKFDWDESYYYLTNDKFKNLKKMRLDKEKVINPKDKYDEYTYFDIIPTDHGWPVFYAMDWISQISFFQHYIYHQVLYVTGATGQGKSTQVPKLLLYALKAIDYKSSGKVVCTQPRVTPTVDNARRIADELGLSIEQTVNTSPYKIKTNNYWVQFKHQKDSHINNKKLHSYLRIVTDGTLLEELKSNPTLLQKVNDKFINKNIYDIVIVDEAHEHNINMDIIIALSKQACYLNNRVKLIVVSATMDDDEPIYRRYFSKINDKLMYPIKIPYKYHPIVNRIENFMPNPIFMDRRYHISPPGETTQYKVDEIYLDSDITINMIPSEKNLANEAQKIGYQKIIDICSKTSSGEILFFANGKREILDAVKYLNQVLPPGNIALPFFSELNETYKSMITKINIKIDQIKNKRENIHIEWGEDYIEDMSVPQGLYKRSIIIATNVAEASITIPRLAFVVDNGYAKVNKFNPKINTTVLDVEKISEASRLQRKGRVGRIGDGTVYYMYKRDARKFIRPKYKITQEDVALSMLSLLGSKELQDTQINDYNNYSKLLISELTNPNLKNTLNNNIDKSHYTVNSGLLEIYKQNYQTPYYYINNNDLFSGYFEQYPKMNQFMFIFNTGQIIDNILDMTGDFYLIHPFENDIGRNVFNDIIKYKNKLTKEIPLDVFKFIIFTLFNKNLLIDFNADSLYNANSHTLYKYRNFIKTELATQIQVLSSKMQTNISESITMLTASSMGCLNEVLETRLLLSAIGYSLKSLPNKNTKWDIFKNIYYDSKIKSDIIFIYNLTKKIKKQFSHLMAFNVNRESVQVIINVHTKNILNKFKQLKEKYDEPPSDFNGILWNKLSTLKSNGKLLTDYKKVILSDNTTYELLNTDIDRNKNEIINWCNKNLLNEQVIINFITNYGLYQLNQYNIDNMKIFDWSNKLSSNFNKLLTNYNIEEKIIRSFLYGLPMQFTFSENNMGKYATLMGMTHAPVEFAKPRFSGEKETMTNLSNEFTHYLVFSEQNNGEQDDETINTLNVGILSHILPEWLIPAVPLIINPVVSLDVKINGEYLNSWILQRFKKDIINNWNQNILIWNSEQTPIMKQFYINIYKFLIKH